MNLKERIIELAKQFSAEYVGVRRVIHQHPELSFKEINTSILIRKELLKIGIADIVSVAETGLLATLHGREKGKTVLLRADMDALPIQEENQVDYASSIAGVMHACGHDVHMSSLLLTARILFQLRSEFTGTVKLLFQPGEELMPGGATLVMKEKAYQKLGTVPHLGQHVMPKLPAGKVGFRSGQFMASMDEIYLTVIGKGGHAAVPEECIDPILIASHIIVASQQLVSRMASPKMPSVLSFGRIIGDGANNIIPDRVTIEGTFRTYDENWRALAIEKLTKLAKAIADGMGGECYVNIPKGYPHLNNDVRLTNAMKNSAIAFLGGENVVDLDLWMAAEDFAYYSQMNPACFYLLGVGNKEKGITSGLHTATFNIDEVALETGGGLMAWLSIEALEQ
ncbi:M20 metallopeptidase family protein [Arenibacter certesii]|uniref:N-acyl-L-amino acid amidohydrolase n=1 Tax=Arenibacter certesii TaxID=228955 RepID=A0A918IWW9_9FLAO|nr:M20 family metallopeptidase [Arenibacter certesii]GGW34547.1 N-acyl-L-amino acid amidohydrolase [Arenibacter certesii]